MSEIAIVYLLISSAQSFCYISCHLITGTASRGITESFNLSRLQLGTKQEYVFIRNLRIQNHAQLMKGTEINVYIQLVKNNYPRKFKICTQPCMHALKTMTKYDSI
jgi:hypothetical protein